MKGLDSCSQGMNLELKKMNTLKFGVAKIWLLDCQAIPPAYMLHICFQNGL